MNPRVIGVSIPILERVQIQDDFSGYSLAALSGLGLEIYDVIPDFRDRCPLCTGRDCAVRHGLYRRRVADRGGVFHEAFPIPRFRCRSRGPQEPKAVTFSVLPAELIPRRRASLPLALWILEGLLEARQSITVVLDSIAHAFHAAPRPWFPEPPAVHRLLDMFSRAYFDLCSSTDPVLATRRGRARWVLRVLSGPARGSPPVLAYHRRFFPRLLFSVSTLAERAERHASRDHAVTHPQRAPP